MAPYYERGGCKLLLGDCLEVMAGLEMGTADALITDPPYCAGAVSEAQRTRADGQGLRSETLGRFGWFVGDNMGTAGLTWLLRSVALECQRILKPSGSLLFFCDWRMLSSLQPAIEGAGVRFQNLVVWDKGNMGLGMGFRCQHEMVLHFTLGAPVYYDKGTSNVLKCPRVSRADREHQTQKPVYLLEQLARVVCPREGVLLDPFCGSGTTGLAALKLGQQFIGIERDEAYLEIAAKRLEAATQQGRLFSDVPEVESQVLEAVA